ncbi:MAG TPA: hypothetical protein VKB18_09850 [Gemmatimonadota bacterium]|nr:hypothetical protein [Gemmatimonadota bacterium]
MIERDETPADRGLPEAASTPVIERLRDVERRMDPAEIAGVWIFPPLPDLEASSEFVLLSRYLTDGRLRLYTSGLRRRAREAESAAGDAGEAGGTGSGSEGASSSPPTGADHEVTEHGAVPADRLPRLLDRFRRRIDQEADPRHVAIEGSRERWEALVPRPEPEAGEGAALEAGDTVPEGEPPGPEHVEAEGAKA